MKIAVAGTGYVGLSLAVLLSQHNEVHALDIVPEKVEKINNYISPIQDDEIERFLAEAKTGERQLDLYATVDEAEALHGRRLRRHRHAHQLRLGQELLRHELRGGRHRSRSLGEPGRLDRHQVHDPRRLHRGPAREAGRQQDLLQPGVPA